MSTRTRESLERAAHGLARRFARRTFLRDALAWTAAALVLAGAAALVARALLGLDASEAVWLLAPVALVPPVAWIRARRRTPGPERALAWLDVHTGGSGALVAAGEVRAIGGWDHAVLERLERAPEPARANAGSRVLAAFGAAAFGAACLVVPVGAEAGPPGDGPSAAEVHRAELERLRTALEALEERVELEPERSAELAERLAALEDELEEQSVGERALEGLDRMGEELADEARRAEERAALALERLRNAAVAAPSAPSEGAEALQEAWEELAEAGLASEFGDELAERLAELAEQLADGLDGAQGIESPEGAAELMERLAELAALREDLAQALAEALQDLADAGLDVDPSSLPSVELSAEELRELLEALREAQLDAASCEEARGGGT